MFAGPAQGRPMRLELTGDTENAHSSGVAGSGVAGASGGSQHQHQLQWSENG